MREFLREHPLAEFRVSRSTKSFHRLGLYSMSWRDPVSGDGLEVFIRGQPLEGGTMPRIGGVRLELGQASVNCWVVEDGKYMDMERPGKFRLNLLNRGSQPLSVHLSPVPAPRGVSVRVGSPLEVTVRPGRNISVEGKLLLSRGFDVPLRYLTFPAVVSSLALWLSQSIEIIISARFDVARQAATNGPPCLEEE